MKVRHTHYSTLYKASGWVLYIYLRWFFTRRSIITLTEVANDKRVARLKRVKGWTFCQVEGWGKDECAVMFKNSVWELAGGITTKRLTERPLPGRNTPLHTLIVPLRSRTAIGAVMLIVSVLHNAAHLERQINRELNREANKNWSKYLATRKAFDWEILACGDHNRDWKRLATRIHFRTLFNWKDVSFTWEGWKGTLGTFKTRFIDFSITTGTITARRVHRLNRASDHRAYSETLEF